MISMLRKIFLILSFACIAGYVLVFFSMFITKTSGDLLIYGTLFGWVGGLFLVLSKAEKFHPLAYLFLLMAFATPIIILAPRA